MSEPKAPYTHDTLSVSIPHGLNRETVKAVESTVVKMLERLMYGQEKGRPPLAWMGDKWGAECRSEVYSCLNRGRNIDAMVYIMFGHINGFELRRKESVRRDPSYKSDLCAFLGLRDDADDDSIFRVVQKLRFGKTDHAELPPDPVSPHRYEPREAPTERRPAMEYLFKSFKDQEDYSDLLAVLLGALDQAAYGKGRERHANDLPFSGQPMQAISDMLNSPLGMAYQVAKKVVEATNMPTIEQQERELFGAINYTAGMIIWLRRHQKA